MKRKLIAAVGVAAMMTGIAACGGDSSDNASKDPKDRTESLTVWLMVDAQSSWKGVVDDASKRFTDATGAQVNVEYQQWANHLTKLDATLAGSDVPDVVELGNTEFPKLSLIHI